MLVCLFISRLNRLCHFGSTPSQEAIEFDNEQMDVWRGTIDNYEDIKDNNSGQPSFFKEAQTENGSGNNIKDSHEHSSQNGLTMT